MKIHSILCFVVCVVVCSPSAFAEQAKVEISTDDTYRYIKSNGIPDHEHGVFPNRGNPNKISAQKYEFRMLLRPVRGLEMTPLTNGSYFGVATNGVPFDPGTAEFYYNDPTSGWKYEALSGNIDLGIDFSNAHVQPNGAYHYHGIPKASIGSYRIKDHSQLVGYAADGFPIYAVAGYRDPDDPSKGVQGIRSSYLVKKGLRPSGPGRKYDGTFTQDYVYFNNSGDLDECNGRVGKTPEYTDGIYHYFLTDSYPFVPRCFKGEPDKSFAKKHVHGAQELAVGLERGFQPGPIERLDQPQKGGRPPQDAINACTGKREGDSCGFRAPRGAINGVCANIQGQTACVPDRRSR